jgi:8-oxo-dGTP diphosphatase
VDGEASEHGILAIPRLTSARLILRAPEARDADAIYKLMNDWEVVRMLSRLPFPYPREAAEKWITSTADAASRQDGYHFVVTGEEEGEEILVGCVGLTLDIKTRSGELGYWVGRRFWGHGVACEAAHRVLAWAFANLPLDRVEAFVSVDNPRSSAVLRHIGMRETGLGERPFLARGKATPVQIFTAGRADIDAVRDAKLPSPASASLSAETDKPLLLVAACALIDTDNRVLLARRPEGKKMAGLWEFPGGKLAPGETPEEALIRELREELGIEVLPACLAPFAFASHAYDKFHLLMPLFICRRWQGFVQPLEGQKLAWVRPQKLHEYEMPAADKPLVPLLRDLL